MRKTKEFWDSQPLGQMSDGQLAKKLKHLGVTRSAVGNARRRRGIPVHPIDQTDWDNEELLGEIPDKELAAKHDVRSSSVARARHRRGLSPAGRRGWRRVDWSRQPLGQVPDTHIAKHLGISAAAVCIARNKRGIPPAPPETRYAPIPQGVNPV